MGKQTIESRTLHRAAEILGGVNKLAKNLHVPLDTLEHWLAGEERVPNIYFLRAVDVVLYTDVIEPSCPGEARPWSGASGGKASPSEDAS